MTTVTAVILAAGASTRMGTQKLLLPLGGEPLVRRTVRQVSEAGFDDLLVVVGCDHDKILDALDLSGIAYTFTSQNPYYIYRDSSYVPPSEKSRSAPRTSV